MNALDAISAFARRARETTRLVLTDQRASQVVTADVPDQRQGRQ
jgi:hypothetical protein